MIGKEDNFFIANKEFVQQIKWMVAAREDQMNTSYATMGWCYPANNGCIKNYNKM